ncbi:MAG: winged helix-turn-helix domain-containing protein, partial [Acidimicrobiales bacterium]
KPFSLEEVIARVRVVVRRIGIDPAANSRLVFGDLEMDEDAYRVWRAGELIELSPTEFKLLRFFLLNPDRVLSRAQILDHVWEYDFGGGANVVETYVSYLRKKLDRLGPPLIQTVRGVGYALRNA